MGEWDKGTNSSTEQRVNSCTGGDAVDVGSGKDGGEDDRDGIYTSITISALRKQP